MFVVAVIGKKKKKKVWRDDEFWKITTAAEVLQVGPFKPPELAISFHTHLEKGRLMTRWVAYKPR